MGPCAASRSAASSRWTSLPTARFRRSRSVPRPLRAPEALDRGPARGPAMYAQITSNKRKSILLLVGFLLLYAGLGWLFSLWFGPAAFYIAIGIAILMLIVNLYMGDDLVALVSGAQQVKRKEDAPELWRRVENLALTAGVPLPRASILYA